MLVKLMEGFNFINVLHAAFTLEDTKRAKKTVNLLAFFTLLGSLQMKVDGWTLMKLTPGFTKRAKSEAGSKIG